MKHHLELTDAELTVLHEGLMLVPYGRAAPVIDSINRQLLAAQAPAAPAAGNGHLTPLPEGADYVRHQGGVPRTG